MERSVIIIGGGPAGLSAATFAASEGFATTVIERGEFGGQARSSAAIENFLGFPDGVTGKRLADLSVKQARKFGANLVHDEVFDLTHDDGRNVVGLRSGFTVVGSTIIIATGLAPRPLPITSGCIRYGTTGRIPKGARVVIVGGGNSAGQAALYALTRTPHVAIVARRALGTTMSAYLVDRIEHSAIRVCIDAEVEGFEGETCLRLSTGETLDCTIVAVYIGSEPATAWVPQKIARDGSGFLAGLGGDNYLRTAIPGVFVAGDVRSGAFRSVAGAVGDGRAAVSQANRYLIYRG